MKSERVKCRHNHLHATWADAWGCPGKLPRPEDYAVWAHLRQRNTTRWQMRLIQVIAGVSGVATYAAVARRRR